MLYYFTMLNKIIANIFIQWKVLKNNMICTIEYFSIVKFSKRYLYKIFIKQLIKYVITIKINWINKFLDKTEF